jgi:hypothetical protein
MGCRRITQHATRHSNLSDYITVTMWVDHYSWFLHAHCQEDAMVKSTLESKVEFESFAKRYNVSLCYIHNNNGIFTNKAFQENIESSNQAHSFCEVGAHWQNGVIECFVGVIMTCACMMLLHAMDMWPDVITSAFMHAICLHNCTPRHGETQSP